MQPITSAYVTPASKGHVLPAEGHWQPALCLAALHESPSAPSPPVKHDVHLHILLHTLAVIVFLKSSPSVCTWAMVKYALLNNV